MRAFFLLLLILNFLSQTALAHTDDASKPKTFVIRFENRDAATFVLSGRTVESLKIRIGRKTFEVPREECSKLRDIHFQTTELLWNGLYTKPSKANYFHLQFRMGVETDRAFGDLPEVSVYFRNGKFYGLGITRRTAIDTYRSDNL